MNRLNGLLVGGLCLILSAPVASPMGSAKSPFAELVISESWTAVEAPLGVCASCNCCDEMCMVLAPLNANPKGAVEIGACSDPGCPVHPACDGSPDEDGEKVSFTAEDLQQLWAEVAAGDSAAGVNAVARHPEFVHYNSARQVLQVEGCGSMIAQLPLSTAQVTALTQVP